MCTYIYIHTFIHTYVHTFTNIYTYIYTYIHSFIHTSYLYMYVLHSTAQLGTTSSTSLDGLLAGGVYHILPSFFKMMTVLCQRGVDFRILFRTFGADSANVIAEFNAFCQGWHPLYGPARSGDDDNNRQQQQQHTNYKETPSLGKFQLQLPLYSGRLLRTGSTASDVHFAHLTNEQVRLTGYIADLTYIYTYTVYLSYNYVRA